MLFESAFLLVRHCDPMFDWQYFVQSELIQRDLPDIQSSFGFLLD